jgi:NCS1 family nucleobase:cation symporter-1
MSPHLETKPAGEFTLERHTIAPIPEDERFGRARELFGVWFGMNMSPLTVVTGAIATVTLGLPIWWAILAIILGHVVGGFAMALHAAQGPQLGVPQLLQARGQFGMYGAAIIALLAIVNFVGFFASNLVVIVQALAIAVPWLNGKLVLILAALTSLLVASFGYKILRWTTISSAIVVGILVALCFAWIFVIHGASSYQWQTGHLTTIGFLSMVAVGAMWEISYAPYVSDYSRYMPADTGVRGAFWGTYAGCVSSAVILMILGAVVGSIASASNTLAALNSLVGPIGLLVLLGFAIATAAYNSVNTYCSALCTLSVAEVFRPGWIPGLRSRLIVTVAVHMCGLAIALVAQANFLAFFFDFITWLLYVLIPWSAINLVDYYIIRKGHYAVEEFFQPGGGRYGNWNMTAIAIYVVGFAIEAPFISTSSYKGFLVHTLHGIDIAWVLGFIVCGGAYYLLAGRPFKAAS